MPSAEGTQIAPALTEEKTMLKSGFSVGQVVSRSQTKKHRTVGISHQLAESMRIFVAVEDDLSLAMRRIRPSSSASQFAKSRLGSRHTPTR
jgi:hypothetical protein